ncbi:MAG: hypothetical protein OK422_04085 [Thaumarchaeota archaeon]|nr:hypothetical protein [Nitrososphaerota archaeon]
MRAFKVRQIKLNRRYFLPLPKLTNAQLSILGKRMADLGYEVRKAGVLRASSREQVIWIDARGLAWSSKGLLDALVPALPDLLECKKEYCPPGEFARLYFNIGRARGGFILRANVRLESSSHWWELRRAGLSGITPDESLAMSFLLTRVCGKVRGITNYPVEGAKVRQIGRILYYESMISTDEYSSGLSTTEEKSEKQVHLPSNSVLQIESIAMPSNNELRGLSGELGEWCYYIA